MAEAKRRKAAGENSYPAEVRPAAADFMVPAHIQQQEKMTWLNLKS
jgi:hypothetical protein